MGHENARMILEVYEHVDWAQKVRAIEGMPDFFALAPKAVRNPIHERRPRKREIDEPGAKYCVRNTVPALNDRKHLIHSEIANQYGNPADKDADHKRNAKTQNPCGPECRSQKERGHKYEPVSYTHLFGERKSRLFRCAFVMESTRCNFSSRMRI